MKCKTRPIVAEDDDVFLPYWITRPLTSTTEVMSAVESFLSRIETQPACRLILKNNPTGRVYPSADRCMIVLQFIASCAVYGPNYDLITETAEVVDTQALQNFIASNPHICQKLKDDIDKGEAKYHEQARLTQEAIVYEALASFVDPELAD
jgi:hypothetical protein